MIALMLIVNLIIIGIVLGGARDQDLTIRRLETAQAFYAAESGMNMAVRELVTDIDEDGDGAIGSISDDANSANDPTFGSASVYVEMDEDSGVMTITSWGASGLSTRRLRGTLEGASGTPGLDASYFNLGFTPAVLANIDFDAAPTTTAVVSNINIASTAGAWWAGGQIDNFAAKFTGKIIIAQGGTWTFYTYSDDGSKLWINGTQVVNNDGAHAMAVQYGSISLTAGVHDFEVRAFEATGGAGLIVGWSGPGLGTPATIPASAFTH